MKAPKNFELLRKIVKEAGVEGVHCDELHPPEWVKQQLVDKLGVPACIVVDGGKIASGPIETIRGEVKDSISRIGDGLGVMMGPSCQILPMTKNENFKGWVDATHEYGKFPLQT
jgi:uroporphyrinogen-III decarboxylase